MKKALLVVLVVAVTVILFEVLVASRYEDAAERVESERGGLGIEGGEPSEDPAGPAAPEQTVAPPEESPAITGTVVDEMTGEAIGGASVFATLQTSGLDRDRMHVDGRTDAKGRFALPGLEERRRYFLDAVAGGYASAAQTAAAERRRLEARPGDVVRIALRRGLRVSGRVEDSAGRPAAGALVYGRSLQLKDEEGVREFFVAEDPTAIKVTTDRDGRFLIDGVAPVGTTLFVVACEGYHDGRFQIDASTDRVVVRLQPVPLVNGRILDAGGRPVGGVAVAAFSKFGVFAAAPTDAGGAFSLPWKEGSRFLIAWGEGRIPRILAVKDTRAYVEARVEPATTIRGVVRDDLGRPVADARVRIHHYRMYRGGEPGIVCSAFLTGVEFDDEDGPVSWWVIPYTGRDLMPVPESITDRDGRFALKAGAREPILTTLIVEKSGHLPALPKWRRESAETVVRLKRVARIEVAAMDAETGRPIKGFMVHWRLIGPTWKTDVRESGTGEPLILELAAGAYEVMVGAPREYRGKKLDPLNLEPGAHRRLEILLERR